MSYLLAGHDLRAIYRVTYEMDADGNRAVDTNHHYIELDDSYDELQCGICYEYFTDDADAESNPCRGEDE